MVEFGDAIISFNGIKDGMHGFISARMTSLCCFSCCCCSCCCAWRRRNVGASFCSAMFEYIGGFEGGGIKSLELLANVAASAAAAALESCNPLFESNADWKSGKNPLLQLLPLLLLQLLRLLLLLLLSSLLRETTGLGKTGDPKLSTGSEEEEEE